ncbi:MAG: tRNA guanosine(34) transglycosylase Tgt [Bacteroidota bacterium]
MKFKVVSADKHSNARAGILNTAHGKIETPIFMPVGTVGSVKAVYQQQLKKNIKAQIILGNTYHLFLRPGLDVIRAAGGLHKFIGWDKPILTDSGGYQVFSLSEKRKVKEDGVVFQSHIDGTKLLFTPENVMDKQRVLGSDIIMAFDECAPYPCEYDAAKKSMELTHRWLKRCVEHLKTTEPIYDFKQTLFPIVQGSVYKDLRKQSAVTVSSYECDGNAIGGLSVGEPAEVMYEMTDWVCSFLPKEKPRYLMGVGTPVNLLECIALGIDMFDCVMPTRNGRNGMLFTSQGIMNMKNKKWQNDFSLIDEELKNGVSDFYSKAYLRHLFIADEILALQIASVHNLSFYLWLVNKARKKIIEGTFTSWKNKMVKQLANRL